MVFRRGGLWEVIRIRYGHQVEAPMTEYQWLYKRRETKGYKHA
jgi:hypothetical protein